MGAVISLSEIIEAMEMTDEGSVSYLDPETGAIITVTEQERLSVEEEEEQLDDLPEWQREMLPKIRAALESDLFLELPDRVDIHEWAIMDEFARAQNSEPIRQELAGVIRGAGAFRLFRSTIRRLGLEQSWYKFRDEAVAEIARDWLEEHSLPYK